MILVISSQDKDNVAPEENMLIKNINHYHDLLSWLIPFKSPGRGVSVRTQYHFVWVTEVKGVTVEKQ